jgi:hypothetical protein
MERNIVKEARTESADELRLDAIGTWRVFTRDSSHLFDFVNGTVTREPGPNAPSTVNDRARPLRSIEACRLGERGRWTMHTDGWSDSVDFFWANTSVIHRIEKISGRKDLEANDEGAE